MKTPISIPAIDSSLAAEPEPNHLIRELEMRYEKLASQLAEQEKITKQVLDLLQESLVSGSQLRKALPEFVTKEEFKVWQESLQKLAQLLRHIGSVMPNWNETGVT